MREYTEATIRVSTPSQKVLLDTELLGQFSDGFWENSRNTSWEFLGKVEVSKEAAVVFEEYIPYDYKGYSVNNKELLSYVGERMLIKARIANALNISDFGEAEALFDTYKIESKVTSEKAFTEDDLLSQIADWNKNGDKFWTDRAKVSTEFISANGLVNVVQAMNDTSYDMKAMRKDLTAITKILKNPVIA